MRRQELKDLWNALLAEAPGEDGWLARRILPVACCPIRAAVQGTSHRPALLFEVAADSIRRIANYPRSVGFEFFPETLTPGPNGTIRLCLVLADDNYHDHFAVLSEDILALTCEAQHEAAVVAGLLSCLDTWQNFMQRHGDGLSPEEQTGLFAEISFLLHVIHPMLGDAALEVWKGPLPGLWDFVVGATAVEIKATTSANAKIFNVPNLLQLERADVGELLVAVQSLIPSASGISLAELVSAARSRLGNTPAQRHHLDRLLLAAGYSDLHETRYRGRKLTRGSIRFFRVLPGFPSLTPQNIPKGIVRASYTVDLEECLPYEVSETTMTQLISSVGA